MTAPQVPTISEVRAHFTESHRTHFDGCWESHKGCAVLRLLDALVPLLETAVERHDHAQPIWSEEGRALLDHLLQPATPGKE